MTVVDTDICATECVAASRRRRSLYDVESGIRGRSVCAVCMSARVARACVATERDRRCGAILELNIYSRMSNDALIAALIPVLLGDDQKVLAQALVTISQSRRTRTH